MLSRVHERGPKEIVPQEAFQELEEAVNRGEIATVAQAHGFLSEREGRITLIRRASEDFSGVGR